ncbi:MAG TPA: MarR family transcriptional regulator [Henriciella marina]|uniref:MarR family winged helix-turn-helix transcriptional regulator n=1 Tax=Henriciella sp. TaxID=1968823 RepID=UPI00185080A1|nr:MarR family transcriptional regulator [Henriciella sp.]HIG23853.1 MarR family transcriptional regulator [Henriciella sp.]HIK63776.1 MarR family transcriptional regulator [Henriciella marina]
MADQQDPQSFDLSTSPSHLLHRAQQAAVNLSTEALAAQGLTLRQFAVLAALASEEGQSQSSLVDRTGIDRSTLAEMVRRMEASGYIERTTSPEDARAKAVSLLAKGREVYDAALPGVEAADNALLAMIRSNRRAGFILSLAAIGAPEEEPEVEDVVSEEAADAGPGKATKDKPKKSKKDKSAKADKSKSDKKKKKKKKK